MPPPDRRLAVVGGGWAGLAAAVEGVRRGWRVTLFEMAPRLGGRARSVEANGLELDNGQHILIGAYTETLGLLRALGVDEPTAFVRMPLTLVRADGSGLRLRPGPPLVAFGSAVLRHRAWRWRERLALLAAASGWAAGGFRCAPALTVDALTARLPQRVRDELIEPLCVAALNTSYAEASAATFLRVLKDALSTGPGSADLLLPRRGLGDLLPAPAAHWLAAAGADVRLSTRVGRIAATAPVGRSDANRPAWSVDGEAFDAVVLAASAHESARLARAAAPAWAAAAAALAHEPIATVYLSAAGVRLPLPMLALGMPGGPSPAQFVFDRGALGGPPGLLAFVVSGARAWVERGAAALEQAVLQQARDELALAGPLELVRTLTEKRATFRCTPQLLRPPPRIASGCHAAGDHVDGPYPATLEGAVRSGLAAVRTLERSGAR